MMNKKKDIIDFFSTRRSTSFKNLSTPIPKDEDLKFYLKIASRSPDYGALEPWRFIILKKEKMYKIISKIEIVGNKEGIKKELMERQKNIFLQSPLIIAVIFSPKLSVKVSRDEQLLSVGGVCLSLLNICHASGWGANWLTGWTTKSKEFSKVVFDLDNVESIAGYIHIGSVKEKNVERKRPNVEQLITWI